ncbi:MAG: hypothetical protein PHS93_00870 [Candidatus Omnitrophica bacterium]|nr:hypothetical protein [Candidatus Omnitrophota bacterium]MDD5351705.1 hypothetical protein [Candidatus Omnitrophota bacterium]MDD5550915.1 hypothetical protein [Candidatus Omnitrophota bacterium]
MNKQYICPVCGYEGLKDPPYSETREPSYEICPCCGFEFGFDTENCKDSYSKFRLKWIENGASWFLPDKKPKDWDLNKQLKNIG